MKEMDLEIVCLVECDDCGKSVITDPEAVALFYSDEFTGATICVHCERPIVCSISLKTARSLVGKGVKLLSWITGEEIDIEGVSGNR